MYFTNLYKVDDPVLQDIYSITQYNKNNKGINYEVGLPISFIKYPTIKEYRKISNTYEHKSSDLRLGVFRLFSLKQDEDDDENEQTKKKLPELNNEGKNAKKNIKINF